MGTPADDEPPPASDRSCGPGRGSPRPGRLRILLVDDHTFFRAGLRSLLEAEDIEVLEARSGEAAIGLAATASPDVVLMDVHMAGISGIEATRRLAEGAPDVPVVMLTMSAEDQHVVDAVRAGARGYLLKDADVAEIVAGARAAAGGRSWISPRLSSALVDAVHASGRLSPDELPVPDLTDRERAVLRLIADGRDNSEIGAEMHISPATVKNHVTSILAKLHLSNRVEAAVYAVRNGLA
jgi:DNA-binding NarL/FixJ family response regulator